MQMHSEWLIPDWDAPSNVYAVMTTRAGGTCAAPFDSMNLGLHASDSAACASSNRALFQSAIQARPVWLSQVHGCDVLALRPDALEAASADASVATQRGLACTIMVADCLPLLFACTHGTVVAAAHAGWRGLAGRHGRGVIEASCAALVDVQRSLAQDGAPVRLAAELSVWLGACIGQDAFEVGPEVRQAFITHDPGAAELFRPGRPGKFHADLQGLARRRLAAQGIRKIFGNDGGAPWCTHSNPSRFFSHRRDQAALGGTGRMAAAVWLA